jgi:hypothetical protein
MICEIINPSDPYTLETDDFLCAAVAIATLGDGRLGLECGDQATPVLFGWKEWLNSYIPDLEEYFNANRGRMADILDSVVIGRASERAEVDDARRKMSAGDFESWCRNRHDARRSSLNDIGKAAKELAARLRRRADEKAVRAAGEV